MLTRYRHAVRWPLHRLPRPLRIAVDWLATLGIAAAIVLVLEAEVAKPYRIPSASMEPTLHCAAPAPGCFGKSSDRVVAAKIVYDFRNPERGDVVVFNAPAAAKAQCQEGGTFVKRIIGLPGDVVSERRGFVYIDGRRLIEPYVDPRLRDHMTRTWPRVSAHQYFVMGDNRAASCDSRQWGTVPRGSLIGPVVGLYWPFARIGFR
ncbi:MAG TPA: signal peptidase I [Gaiellaceae bacterium]|nr:signal peptidase I [Gaiellaceae bacterium]